MLRTRSYVTLLVFAALIGVPIAVGAYYFLTFVDNLQTWVFTDLPDGIGFDGAPVWWPVLPLVTAGLIVGAVIRYLPGRGGHSPADGFKTGSPPTDIELPGILLASLAGLGLGVVIGPEAPLIALGGGVAALLVRLAKKGATAEMVTVVGAAGSFAAVSALLGNPLLGAFLLMEALGLGGAMATLVLLPGLLAAGIGALVFIGFGTSTGVGEFSLVVPNLPPFDHPDAPEFLWAFGIGVGAAVVGTAIRWTALQLRPHVERRLVLLTPVVGLAIAALAIAYAELTDKSSSDVLFSGQTALPVLINQSATYSVGALLLLILCKSLAYSGVAQQLPGRPHLPGHVHRCRRRDRALPPPRAEPGRRRGHGHRGDDRGAAPVPPDRRAAGDAAARRRRHRHHAGRHRGRRRRLRGVGVVPAAPHPADGAGRFPGARPRPGAGLNRSATGSSRSRR